MNARTLNCYSCGAAVSSDAPTCGHCGARLATIACPSCFGMMFLGSKFCPDCGSLAVDWQGEDSGKLCPSCQVSMLRGTIGVTRLHECARCFGIWLDAATFEQICRTSEQQAAVLGSAQSLPARPATIAPVRYLRCPECQELMRRVNFARCSGVVIDVCRAHGTWFDRDELHRIVLFIRTGGLELSRERQMAELERERQRLETKRREASDRFASARQDPVRIELLNMVVGATGGLLNLWRKK